MEHARRLLGRILVLSLGSLLLFLFAGPAFTDPAASPPPCNVMLDRLFCGRITFIEADPADAEQDRYFFEGEIVNWTNKDCYGLRLVLNRGGVASGPDPGDQTPYFCGAFLDSNGRPLDDQQTMPIFPPAGCQPPFPSLSFPIRASSTPTGNMMIPNDWTVSQAGLTRITFSVGLKGTPVPAPVATIGPDTFRGLLDPAFESTSPSICITALTQMIPGSVNQGGSPAFIEILNKETIDNGPNVRDGFTIVIDDFDPGEEVSITWWMIDEMGNFIGVRPDTNSAVLGDEYGFGTYNIHRFANPGGRGDVMAVSPLWTMDSTNEGRVNTGYDPPSSLTPDQPLNFAEDEDGGGADVFPINPIPPGVHGTGDQFAYEQGTAVGAPLRAVGDGDGMFNGKIVRPGDNLDGERITNPPRIGAVPAVSEWGLGVVAILVLLGGALAVWNRARSS